jgi:hypothetical protein
MKIKLLKEGFVIVTTSTLATSTIYMRAGYHYPKGYLPHRSPKRKGEEF